MKILVKNNKERVKNQEVEMKKVQKLLRRSLATGLALVMTVSSMTIVPGSWQVHAAEASGQIGISNADELKKIGKDKDYPMDGDYVLKSGGAGKSRARTTAVTASVSPDCLQCSEAMMHRIMRK